MTQQAPQLDSVQALIAGTPDPVTQAQRPDRAYYETGVLLGPEDFLDEQTYHRARLARALAYLTGAGTLAGLKVDTEHEDEQGAERTVAGQWRGGVVAHRGCHVERRGF